MTLQTRMSEIEEAHVDSAFLALSKLRDSFIARERGLWNIDTAIGALRAATRQNMEGTEND